ncbi:MAG: L-threonylcarbamoyladenylate synthase [Candidatus Hydrothermarchaeales archaeon]
MDHLIVKRENLESAIAEAISVLRDGGLVVYPTDTLYGLGCDALNEEAIKKVFTIKKRPEDKPLSIAVSSIGMMEKYAYVTPLADFLAKKFLPGALTVILPKKNLPDILTSNKEDVAIRVPDNEVALKLIESLGRPITATSANLSGMEPPTTPNDAMRQIDADLILDSGDLESKVPSTLVDLTGKPRLLRAGKIKWKEIERVVSESEEVESNG